MCQRMSIRCTSHVTLERCARSSSAMAASSASSSFSSSLPTQVSKACQFDQLPAARTAPWRAVAGLLRARTARGGRNAVAPLRDLARRTRLPLDASEEVAPPRQEVLVLEGQGAAGRLAAAGGLAAARCRRGGCLRGEQRQRVSVGAAEAVRVQLLHEGRELVVLEEERQQRLGKLNLPPA